VAYHPEWIRAYYGSNIWRLRRSSYYKRHPYQCASCGTKKKLALHHITYSGPWGDLRNQTDWGKEPDQALMPLCRRRWFRQGCHNNAHAADKSGRFKDLETATEHIVKLGRRRRARHRKMEKLFSRKSTSGD
jgi:hypothetical protein